MPVTNNANKPIVPHDTPDYLYSGLSKREYFSGLALQAILTRDGEECANIIARDAVMFADALLAALERKGEG